MTTVKEVIERLQKFPETMEVYVSDSEYGDEEVCQIEDKEISVLENGKYIKKIVILIT